MSNLETRSQRSWFSRLKRLTLKELRETLRDRRTIVTLILMPLIVYPILSLIFRTVLVSALEGSLGEGKPAVLRIAFDSNISEGETTSFIKTLGLQIDALDLKEAADKEKLESEAASAGELANSAGGVEGPEGTGLQKGRKFDKFLTHQWFLPSAEDAELSMPEVVLKNDVDLGVRFVFPERDEAGKPVGHSVGISVVRRNTANGRAAADYFQEQLRRINHLQVAERLRRGGLLPDDPIGLQPIVVAVDPNAP